MRLTDAEKTYLLAACKLATATDGRFAWRQATKDLGWPQTRADAVLVALANRRPSLIRTSAGQYCYVEPVGQVLGKGLIEQAWKPARR